MGQARCWLCERKVRQAAGENPYASPRPIAESASVQFSLASLFLVMTLIAVCLGVFMLMPGVGVLLVVVSTPALIRTVVATNRQKKAGAPPTTIEKVESFVISLFIMLAVGLATSVAFFTVCFAGAMATGAENPASLMFGLIIGLVSAGATAGYLLWLTRPGG